METYEFYYAPSTNSYTLLRADSVENKKMLEKDAERVVKFVAPSWEDARNYAELYRHK